MSKYLIVVAVVWLIPLQTIAAEHPAALELINKYVETQGKLQSFILNMQTQRKGSSSTQARGKFTTDYSSDYEIRFDDNQICARYSMWGKLNGRLNLTKDEANYHSRLWDGKTSFEYSRAANSRHHPFGRVIIDKCRKKNDIHKRNKNSTKQFPGRLLRGYFPADADRIDSILRKANSMSVRDKMENINDSNCYVIEADTKHGKYTVWIDPMHGYHIAKATIKRRPDDTVFPIGYTLQQTEKMFCVMENVRFEKIDGVWAPMQLDLRYGRTFPGDNFFDKSEIHYKVTNMILNPDHEALGSFIPNDILDGSSVALLGIDVKYIWQDGKLIPDIDREVIAELDKMAADIMADKGSSDTKADLAALTTSNVLARYQATQNKLQSFIAKSQSTIEKNSRQEQATSEFRFDGNRVNHRSTFWDGLLTTKASPGYKSFLWDGKQLIEYRQAKTTDNNKVFIKDNDYSKKRLLAEEYKGAALLGICSGDYARVDTILAKADKISLRDKTEKINKSDCFVIDAQTKRGQYTVWFDHQHSYNIAKIDVQRKQGDLVGDGTHLKADITFSLTNVRFEKVNDIWCPMEADMQQTEAGSDKITKCHHKRTDMILDPDFETLKSFVPDDIPNGTKASFPGVYDKNYTWQNGAAIEIKL